MRYLPRDGFRYDQNPPVSPYPLETFLLHSKLGYCQQFAGAMALLLRMGGVPARVSVGFTPGSYDGATHSYIVTDQDAHAWVEVWFPRYGWVRFDPTPRGHRRAERARDLAPWPNRSGRSHRKLDRQQEGSGRRVDRHRRFAAGAVAGPRRC